MTIFANRVENQPHNIKVSITYGPVSTSIVEDEGHVRSLRDQLNRILDEGKDN